MDLAYIENQLKSHNIRCTAMRILVYQFLMRQNAAASLTDLEHSFDKSERTTLYRTLKTFEANGVVHTINDGTGIAKYALCQLGCSCDINTDLHMHFHCENCNETTCLTDHKIPKINLPVGYKPTNVNLVVKGVCNKCSL